MSKSELYSLVAELRSERWTVRAIAFELRVTERRVQQIVADLTQPATPFSRLHPLLQERITHFAKRNECQAVPCETS